MKSTPAANPKITQSLLMVTPTYFNIAYAINPFMQDVNGKLHVVDTKKAHEQWNELKKVFEKINLKIHLLEGQPQLLDMVFCANQSFPFIDPQTRERCVLLSRMRSDQRKPEVAFFKDWFVKNNYQIFTLESDRYSFEANGDLISVPGTNEFWGGVGPRTDRPVYDEIQSRFYLKIHALDLVHPHFYHLDTCFFVIDAKTCAYIPEAFSTESQNQIKKGFERAIEIPLNEGLQFFAGNAFCPDGKNVILQKGATETAKRLHDIGLQTHEVDTSEFMKSGGSVFCMKLALLD